MEPLQFPKGSYYMIISKSGDQALRIQQNDPDKFDKSRIIATQPNPQDTGQLFMVDKINEKEDGYQIINCISDMTFDEQSKNQVRLRKGKQSSDQLFAIKIAPVQAFHRYFWIKTDTKGKQALSLQGVLRVAQFSESAETQLFRFQQVGNNNNNTLSTSAIIMNNMSGKVIDVPASTRKTGQRIGVWDVNKRFNQRWQFQRQGKGTVIRNVGNGLCLDIAGESRDNGAKIIQWQHTGGTNQQWFPQPCGNGMYKFRSAHQPSLYLAIKDQKKEKGGQLQACSEQNPSMYWRIQGVQP